MHPKLPLHGWRFCALLLGAGALTALVFPPICFLPILPVGLLVLYRAAEDASSWKKAALYGFLFGLGLHTVGLYWLTNAILTRVHDFWWVLPFAAPGVACIIAPLAAVPAVACRLVAPGWRRVFMFAGSWTLADMARVLIFSGFPWNPLGSALELPGLVGDVLIQPASLVGVDGLTLALVLIALAMTQLRRGVVLSGLCVIIAGGWSAWHLGHHRSLAITNPRIVVVQGNVSEDQILTRNVRVGNFLRYLHLTEEGVHAAQALGDDRPIVVVWPESGFPGILDEDATARDYIARAAGGALAMIGSDREDHGHWYNSLEVVDPTASIAAIYDKSRLVPFGEYKPWIIPFNLLPETLTPGSGLRTLGTPGLGRVGPMVCYEVVFSGAVVAKGQRPNWLVTISNDAWYGNSAGPRQHLATGRMRAVEEGLPLVFANNTGISALFDGYGHEVQRITWGRADKMVANIPSPLPETLFGHLGRHFPLILAAICVVVAFLPRRRTTP
ncbi:apolipoprotein N-acyltransferase [Neokomagataea tanensis]|uniref:Apolipoprotein N-acyltransferase n=1 Tax=Neokomagataea tanensis TaxID=661191 RepID=A0A4Y6V7F0_9PROT|nr:MULTISPECIES: apolipoprotein N-acyltransferase [Neokomagataea]QDH24427.1 apolipoprotein N-acyltransferase [Neokomagataea tanensis]